MGNIDGGGQQMGWTWILGMEVVWGKRHPFSYEFLGKPFHHHILYALEEDRVICSKKKRVDIRWVLQEKGKPKGPPGAPGGLL